MAKQVALEVERREASGTGASRRLRRVADQVPGIIYGGGEAPEMIALPYRRLARAMQEQAFFSQVVKLCLEGTEQPAVLRELQRHPATEKVLHADFLRIRADRAIQIAVPLRFVNADKCAGARQGGLIAHNLIEVEVSCLPGLLPESIEVDIAALEVGQSLHLSDLQPPEGVAIVALAQGAGHDASVVTVQAPRGGMSGEEDVSEEADSADEADEA